MKNIILQVLAICFLSSTLFGQEISRLKNYYTKTYLNTENGSLEASVVNDASKSAHWLFIDAGSNTFRIKNVKYGTFLNIETGDLKSSIVQDGWLSAFWTMEKVEGTDLVRINNVWKPYLYLNVEDGLACSPIKEGWFSARWELEAVENQSQQFDNEADSIELDTEADTTNQVNNGTTSSNDLMNIDKVLAAHNTLRREVGVAPLEWSSTLAANAQSWADNLMGRSRVGALAFEHSNSSAGENLLTGNSPGSAPEQRILMAWGEKEKVNFDPQSRKCYPGRVCGHYTQVVWRKTTKVGCGVAINSGGEYILVCQYDPAGNFNNEPAF